MAATYLFRFPIDVTGGSGFLSRRVAVDISSGRSFNCPRRVALGGGPVLTPRLAHGWGFNRLRSGHESLQFVLRVHGVPHILRGVQG